MDPIHVFTGQDYVDPLRQFFHRREKNDELAPSHSRYILPLGCDRIVASLVIVNVDFGDSRVDGHRSASPATRRTPSAPAGYRRSN